MNRIYYTILFLVLSLQLRAQVTTEEITQTYYISSSTGNDQNDGLSPETALRTIKALPKKTYICVRLKCGDVFFNQLNKMDHCIVESYDEGQEPVLCGFKILTNPDVWEYDYRGYWVLDLTQEDNFTGYLAKQNGYWHSFNDVGMIYDYTNDCIYGHNVKSLSALKDEGDFFMNEHFKNDSLAVHPFKKIYWKISSDPRKKGKLYFSMGAHGVESCKNMIIRNIAIVGFSRHGIAGGVNMRIENCRIDLIGGAIQGGYTSWVRYGNGIEFGAQSHDNMAIGCTISRTYDCGTTIQGRTTEELQPVNIHFSNNKFYHCRQAFEHSIRSNDNSESVYTDCSFNDNICYLMGENEFNSAEKRDANILSYENASRALDIQRNTFYGAPLLCGYNFGEGTKDNIIYIFKGQYLNHFHGKANYPTIYANSQEDIEAYKQRTGDDSKIIILEKESAKSLKMERKIQKIIRWEKLKLSN